MKRKFRIIKELAVNEFLILFSSIPGYQLITPTYYFTH